MSQLVHAMLPMSMDVALKLELGIPARLWNNLESNYRTEVAR